MSIVDMLVHKIKNPKIIWKNDKLRPKNDILSYCYSASSAAHSESHILTDSKVALGERYGGQGLGANGGGVRCGVLDDVQIKGIGANRLAGLTTDYFHSYGGASLHEGVLEAIWGEVTSDVLPFGGVRSFALVDIDMRVPVKFPKTGHPSHTKQVLILRECVVRPAHFMRAVLFLPKTEDFLCHDTHRTKEAVKNIINSLRSVNILFGDLTDDIKYIDDALWEIFRRYARQIASARARRIMHGSLTDSNVALDGRWLDFGSISTVGDFGRIIIPRGAPDFLLEEASFINIADSLVFYLSKYYPNFKSKTSLTSGILFNSMVKNINEYFKEELLKLCGFTVDMLKNISTKKKSALYDTLNSIRKAGNSQPFTILSHDNDYVPVMPLMTGQFHLNTILKLVSKASSEVEAKSQLGPHLTPRLIDELVRNYVDCLCDLNVRMGEEEGCGAFIRLNSMRRNSTPKELFRTVIYPEIEELEYSGACVEKFINKKIEIGIFKLADLDKFTLKSNNGTTLYVSKTHIIHDGRHISFSTAFAEIPEPVWD
jgi:hypothetical protein